MSSLICANGDIGSFPDTPYALLVFLPAGLRLLSPGISVLEPFCLYFLGVADHLAGQLCLGGLAVAQALVGSVSAYLALSCSAFVATTSASAAVTGGPQ